MPMSREEPVKTLCAWCSKVLQEGRLIHGEVSHGICKVCMRAQLKAAGIEPKGNPMKRRYVKGKKWHGRYKNPRSGPVDHAAARELELFVRNDADLYRQQYVPILKNLVAKKARGIYDRDKAVKLWMHLVDNAARKYIRQFGVPGSPIDAVFNKATRLAVARDLEQHERTEIGLGAYDEYIPKKYRK